MGLAQASLRGLRSDPCKAPATWPGHRFPVASVSSDHKLSAFKQLPFILLLLLRAEVWHRSHWAKIEVWAGLVPSGALGKNSFSLSFPASTGACIPWLVGPSSHHSSLFLLPSRLTSFSVASPSSSFSEGSCGGIGLTLTMQNRLPISRSLT